MSKIKKTEETTENTFKDRQAVDKLMNETNREAGNTVLCYATQLKPKTRIPCGVEPIDKILKGGILSSLFTVIWGNKSAGKTTLVYKFIAEAQKLGKRPMLLDYERSFDPLWATKKGINCDNLLIGQFDTAEAGLDVFRKYATDGLIDMLVIDSIQGLSPKGEQETKTGKTKTLDEDTMALLAKKLSQFFRITAGKVYRGDITVLLVGQARTDLGSFIATEKLSGGNALAHWASLILKIRRGQGVDAPMVKFVKDGKKMKRKVGFDCVIKIEKTKMDTESELTEVHVPFYYESGFDKPETKEVIATEGAETQEEATDEENESEN
jgi:RecA/RadA recombinase